MIQKRVYDIELKNCIILLCFQKDAQNLKVKVKEVTKLEKFLRVEENSKKNKEKLRTKARVTVFPTVQEGVN